MLFADHCPVCGARGPAPCPGCAAGLRPAPALRPPPGIDACHAVFAYEGVGRELIARLKYRNARGALARVAGAMAQLVDRASVDVVTWVPTSGVRRRERGFDQGELLARAVARGLGRPCRLLLHRLDGPPQTGRAAAARRVGPALVARGPVPGRVLVVDDVCTTGATLATAARVLRDAGAAGVNAVTAARTPLKPGTGTTDTASDVLRPQTATGLPSGSRDSRRAPRTHPLPTCSPLRGGGARPRPARDP